MIEIKSEIGTAEDGRRFLSVIMKEKDREWFNCAFSSKHITNGFQVHQALQISIKELCYKIYPNCKLLELKSKLDDVEATRGFLLRQIEIEEENLKDGD